MPQVTTARLRQIDRRWRATINKYRGPIPAGLAVAHIVAESNGVAAPTVRDAKRSIGMMRTPLLTGRKHGYSREELEKPVVSIYVWCLQTNKDSAQLHKVYPDDWTEANCDFWLSLRLIYKLGFTNYTNLIDKVVAIKTAGQVTADIQNWVRNTMTESQRFGTFRPRDLRRIVDELDLFRQAMTLLDGPNKVSALFSQAPELNPGGEFETLRVASA